MMSHRLVFSKSVFWCVCLAVLMVACRASRSAVPAESISQQQPSGAVAVVQSPKQLFEALVDSYRPWSDVSMSVKCTLRSPKSMSVSGKATMIRDEEIRLSLRMFGFEVGGLYIDRDSIFFYEKLNRTMVAESMKKLTDATGLSISDMQDILLGQVAYPGARRDDDSFVKKFKFSSDGDRVVAHPRSSALPWYYTLMSTPDPQLLSLSIQAPPHGAADCSYRTPFETDAGPVSPAADIKAEFGKQSLDASVIWSLETARWNNGVTAERSVPKGYRRIPLQQLIKSLNSSK